MIVENLEKIEQGIAALESRKMSAYFRKFKELWTYYLWTVLKQVEMISLQLQIFAVFALCKVLIHRVSKHSGVKSTIFLVWSKNIKKHKMKTLKQSTSTSKIKTTSVNFISYFPNVVSFI